MNGLSSVEKLLDDAKVDWLSLSDVTRQVHPSKYLVKTSKYDDSIGTPVLATGRIDVIGYTDETDGIYKASDNPVIIFDDLTTAGKWVDFDFKVKSSVMKMVSSSDEKRFLLKFVYYWLKAFPNEFIDRNQKLQWIRNFFNKKIPIPCPNELEKSVEIQTKIVRLLDTFTEFKTTLSTELASELGNRKKQYHYYRDHLLTLNNTDVEWKSLGNLVTISTGSRNKDEATGGGKYPFFGQSYRPSKTDSYDFDETAIIIAGRMGAGPVFHYVTGKYGLHLGAYRIIVTVPLLNPKFLFYCFEGNFDRHIERTSSQTSFSSLRRSTLEEYPIPIPHPDNLEQSLDEQARIVDVLDKFNALTNAISENLQHEIDLRQKQYEYYCGKLLNFPKQD